MHPIKLQKYILLTDSVSGMVAGIVTLSFSTLLSNLYQLDTAQIQFISFMNIVYGCYSGFILFSFASGNFLLKEKIIILILANCIWSGHCFTQIWYLKSSSSIFGILHIGFEGIYVLILAYLETKFLLPYFK